MVHGTSYPNFKREVCDYLKTLAPVGSWALDIGAGAGVYADHLNKHYQMDAVEIFPPTVKYLLETKKYRTIYTEDIRTCMFHRSFYDLVIIGDVLEHLSIEDAKKVIEGCSNHCNHLMVAIPYQYKQDAINGNAAEVHIQDDLTKENFNERYPGFTLVFGNEVYGYYIRSKNS